MALPGTWGRARAVWLGPGHQLEVKDEDIVVKVGTVPASEDDHLGAADQVGAVVESGSWSATSLWALIPSHGEWVQGVEVSEHRLLAFASKDNNSGSSQDSCVPVTCGWRGSRDSWLDPS